jgi:hypothetical protein
MKQGPFPQVSEVHSTNLEEADVLQSLESSNAQKV